MSERRLPDAERLTAFLRIVAVPVLIVGEAYVPNREPSEGRFVVVIALFSVYALATLVLAARGLTPAAQWMAVLDIAFAAALSYSSGGGFSQLRFAFLFPMVAVAFRGRPL